MRYPMAIRYMLALITAPSANAAGIANELVNRKLAACVNIIPEVESIYWWEGKIQKDKEVILMAKTREDVAGKLVEAVKEMHPYENCEIILTEIDQKLSSQKYLMWIDDSLDFKTK